MKTPLCSHCQTVIPPEDVNVARDVAYCRKCNQVTALSQLVQGVDLNDEVDLHRPPPGAWHGGGSLSRTIGGSHRSIGMALGALAFGLFWNGVVSIFVLVAAWSTLAHMDVQVPDWFPAPDIGKQSMPLGMTLFLWVFLLPFIAVGVFMIATFLSALAGRTEVQLQHESGTVFTGFGPIGYRRRFPVHAVKDVRIESRQWRDSDGHRQSKTQIVIELENGKTIKFGSMLREERMKFVAAALRKAIRE